MTRIAAILRRATLPIIVLAVALTMAVGASAQPEPGSDTTTPTTETTPALPTTETTSEAATTPAAPTPPAQEPTPPAQESPQPPVVESAPPQQDAPPAPADSSDAGLIAALIVAVVVISLALVGAVILVFRYRAAQASRRYVPQSAYSPQAQPGPPPPAMDDEARHIAAERDTLALTLIEAADAAGGDAVQIARIHRGLERAGYQVIDPTGHAFDSRYHEALHNRPTDDPAQNSLVAATVRLGYRRDNRVIRQPEVVVYHYTGQGRRS